MRRKCTRIASLVIVLALLVSMMMPAFAAGVPVTWDDLPEDGTADIQPESEEPGTGNEAEEPAGDAILAGENTPEEATPEENVPEEGATEKDPSEENAPEEGAPEAGASEPLPSEEEDTAEQLQTLEAASEYAAAEQTDSAAGWKQTDGKWQYPSADGQPLKGSNWIEALGHRYVFDNNGNLQTGNADGDLLWEGNQYYINPEKNLEDPSTCYCVTEYTRSRPGVGVTYYNQDGITYRGWVDGGSGKLLYQTVLRGQDGKELKDEAGFSTYIYVWGGQQIPEGRDPLDKEKTIAAGNYLFGEDGVLVTGQTGWYTIEGDSAIAGEYYLTGADGQCALNTTVLDTSNGHRYLFGADGQKVAAGDEDLDKGLTVNGNWQTFYIQKGTDYLFCDGYRPRQDSKGNDLGLTYYDPNGITYRGWVDGGNGRRLYQTVKNIAGVGELYFIVWRAQSLPAGNDPVTREPIPAGRYLFDDSGILVAEAGWHACAENKMYLTDENGMILDEIYADPSASDQSGLLSQSKLSKQEIRELLQENPLTLPEIKFDKTPSCKAPYATGVVKQEVLQAAADRLSALRNIAGLPGVTLDASMCETAQYGAVLMGANGKISHSPSQPSDMSNEFYWTGVQAARRSNLYSGRSLTSAVDGFMHDSDTSNIDMLGHRRWQLNPAMGKVGFGYAAPHTQYVVEMCMDSSARNNDYDFISWPASGNFPGNQQIMFRPNTAWSVTLNPARYETPDTTITVSLTRVSDGHTWTFTDDLYEPSASGDFFEVDTMGFGVRNCIIFRPSGITKYEGTYIVRIDGLRTSDGESTSLAYSVDFFDV